MSFCDITFADEYFRKRAFSSAWDGDEKEIYLETAAQQIVDYCSFEDEYGDPVEYSDSDAPDWLKRANCEQALYLLNLGKAFNSFYRECPVLAAETPELAAARLALSGAVREIIVDGLSTLTIQVPEAM